MPKLRWMSQSELLGHTACVILLLGCSDQSNPGEHDENGHAGNGGSSSGQGGQTSAGPSSGAGQTGGFVAVAGAKSSDGGGGAAVSGTGGMSASGAGLAGTNDAGRSAGSPGAGGLAGEGGRNSTAAGAGGTAGGAASGGAEAGRGGGSIEAATLLPDPSWSCGMMGGIVPPTRGELVFTATLDLGKTHDFGVTPYGERRLHDVDGGTLKGDRIDATFLKGGLDLELELSNGSRELEQITMLRSSDGALIYMRSCGVAPAGETIGRIVPDFEVANNSTLSWLNTGKFVGTRSIDSASGEIELKIYDVSAVSPGDPKLQLIDPPNSKNQPWECSTETGSRGAMVFTETVTLGTSLSVGASKRGTRNVIPITGGTVSGRVAGSVLPGGADYQLIGGGSTKLDARYTLSSSDGELILVRNCGAFGALVPLFETRADGPYSFLNTNDYVSSDPGGATGGVSITFYERN